jgi:hypothetical protein
MALTAKQELFCREYAVDHNATQAAVRAGYSPHTANEQGARLLANVSVRERVRELTEARQEKLDVKADDVFRGLLTEARDRSEGSSPSARVSAWSWIGKALAMFTDRHEHTFPDDEADAAIEAELQRLVSEPAGANGHTQEPPRGPGGPPPNGRPHG